MTAWTGGKSRWNFPPASRMSATWTDEIIFPKEKSDSEIFQAGTKLEGDKIVTNGGRVMVVVNYGETIQAAQELILKDANSITYKGKYFRRDIGKDII